MNPFIHLRDATGIQAFLRNEFRRALDSERQCMDIVQACVDGASLADREALIQRWQDAHLVSVAAARELMKFEEQ